ncbi:hypothetical protein EZV62_019947 [Acer yangbiense]|uniref:Protein kinase domain-containing protein n=1 Tax=Acer yangbiense TaxID=1000413 RepID=A0A5C7HCM2_9ROSI|nr:hypothetical protein EZV62_019947 [Acer yangbiense]
MMATACDLVSLVIILMSFWIHEGHADARTDVVSRSCGKVNATRPEIVVQRFSSMSNEMKRGMVSDSKFAISESGEAPDDKVYMLSQCMEDLSNIECESCFYQVYHLLQHCLPSNGGRVYLDGCFARFENYNFFKEVNGPADSKRCGNDIEQEEEFKELVERVTMKMVKKAPGNSGFAEGQENTNGLSAYGIATCWKTLDKQSCAACLLHAAASSSSCLPSIEGRALLAGCYLRYSYYSFANSRCRKNDNSGSFHAIFRFSFFLNQDSQCTYHALLYISYAVYGLAVCFFAIGVGFYLGKVTYKRKLRRNMQKGVEVDLSALHGTLRFLQFKYSTIDKATESFSEANKLGRGGYGEVFKCKYLFEQGTLQDGREIAIKRLFLSRKNQIEEICNEMDVISRTQHKNLVRFLGCCFTNADSFFVYEYLANRSLDRILFGKQSGVKDIPPGQPHFRLSIYFNYMINMLLSYRFHTWKHFQAKTVSEMIDNSMEKSEENVEEMERVVWVGLLCTQESASQRPTMKNVVEILKQKEMRLPTPSKPPFTDEYSFQFSAGKQF